VAADHPHYQKCRRRSYALQLTDCVAVQDRPRLIYRERRQQAGEAGGDTATFDHQENSKAIPLPTTVMHELGGLLAGKATTVNLYSAYPFPNRRDRRFDEFNVTPGTS
jgi:hypothetical protein